MSEIYSHIKKYKGKSIFVKEFIIIFLIIFLLMLIINVMIMLFYSRIIDSQNRTKNLLGTVQIKNDCDAMIENVNKISYSLLTTDNVQLYLMQDNAELSSQTIYRRYTDIFKAIKMYLASNIDIKDINIYSKVNNYVLSNVTKNSDFDFSEKEKYNKQGKTQWIEFDGSNGNDMKFFYDTAQGGAIVITVSLNSITKSFFSEIPSDNQLYIIDSDNKILYSSNQECIGLNIHEAGLKEGSEQAFSSMNKKETVISEKSGINSWRYAYVYPKNAVLPFALPLFGIIFVISSVIAVLIAYVVSMRIYRPVTQIIELLQTPTGDICMHNLYNNNAFGEFEYITKSIIETFSSYENIKDELEEKLKLLNKHQMIALQSQINPHFIFNTLEIINLESTVHLGERNDISMMVSSLAKLMRIGIETREQMFSIQNELEHLKTYVRIMKHRYRDKFCISYNVPDEFLKYKIMKITLQPIVENAISHGIKPLERNGNITVECKSEENNLIFEIADDGVGMSDEKITEVNEYIQNNEIVNRDNIGLQNVNQRIGIVFGKAYGLKLYKNSQGGITVRVRIPKI